MCRLFGFRSIIPSRVHHSLVAADNALMDQSPRHPDGWGVAYYHHNIPHLIRSLSAAVDSELFRQMSGVVSAHSVLAHLRAATVGRLHMGNVHPFQHQRWTFAHNGNIPGFPDAGKELLALIPQHFHPFVLGETDSELLFFLILGELEKEAPLETPNYPLDVVARAARTAVAKVCELVGAMSPRDDAPPSEHFLTFIITNGRTMLAHQGGKAIHYSYHKKRCPERDICPAFQPSCEDGSASQPVSHLVLTSETFTGANVWSRLGFREMVGVDDDMRLTVFSPDQPVA